MEFVKEYIKTFETEAEYTAFKASSGYNEPNVSYISGDNVVHYNKIDPCKSEIVKTTYEFVDLGLHSGIKWANKNIGARTETDYGQYFQWGDLSGYTAEQISGACQSKSYDWPNYRFSKNGVGGRDDMTKYNLTDGLLRLESSDDTANAILGGNCRMPDNNDFIELFNATTNVWVTNYNGSGVNGRLFTSNTNGNSIFIPGTGLCNGSSFNGVGSSGRYWTRMIFENTNYCDEAYSVYFDSNSTGGGLALYRSYGMTVRPVVS